MNVMYDYIAQTFQQEAGRVIAALYASLRDLELVEDTLQDALVLALEHWPVDGVSPNPGAWITTAARRKAIDPHGLHPCARTLPEQHRAIIPSPPPGRDR